jgi:asparagine synthase (glutamine-hydrolysing)
MAFIITCPFGGSADLSDGVTTCLAHHSAVGSPVEVVRGQGVSAAAVAPARLHRFADGVTITVSGRPMVGSPGGRRPAELSALHSLYRQHGRGLCDNLFGSFAIAIADEATKSCMMLRDRVGFVPLFYGTDRDGGVWVSDSIKPLLASRFRSFSLDIEAIYRYLYLKAFESPDTVVREVRSLPPGCVARFDQGEVETRRYWDLPLPADSGAEEVTDGEERLTELLEAALKDATPPGGLASALLLSGGVDSGVLAALQRSLPHRFAVNVCFAEEWRDLDESADAQRVAAAAGMNLHKVLFDFPSLVRSLPLLFWNNNLPTANSGFKVNLVGMSLGTEPRVGTYLLGEGADTLLGYGWKWRYFHAIHRLAPLASILPGAVQREVLSACEVALFRLRGKHLRNRYTDVLSSYLGSLLGYWKWKGSTFRTEEVTRLFAGDKRPIVGRRLIHQLFQQHYDQVSRGTLAEKFIYASLKSYTPNQQLMNYHTASNYFGAELACPYLDERLMQFCLRLPVAARQDKQILKRVAESLIPREVVHRPKRVFLMPMAEWVKGALWPLVEQVFSREVVERRGLFSTEEMATLRESYRNGSFTSWSDIWSFVLLEAWLRINLDYPVPAFPNGLAQVFPEVGSLSTATELRPEALAAV